jgi:DNA helicase II / ATP-dependent DNA helicase PcrA
MALEQPSPYQQAVFQFVKDEAGNGVVQATAGSGKTTTLVEVAGLIPEDARTLFLAFNKRAALQLKEKLPERVKAATIHSRGLWLLNAWLVKRGKKVNHTRDKYKMLVREAVGELLEAYVVPERTRYRPSSI